MAWSATPLNPVMDALRRNGGIDFVHVRNEEYGVFAAVAEARLTGQPVAVCGTAGPGVVRLINGLLDAREERVPIIVLAGDTETALQDSSTVEELNPYRFFADAAVYVGRLVNPRQLRHVVTSAVAAALTEGGPAVIALPGDVAAAPVRTSSTQTSRRWPMRWVPEASGWRTRPTCPMRSRMRWLTRAARLSRTRSSIRTPWRCLGMCRPRPPWGSRWGWLARCWPDTSMRCETVRHNVKLL